VLKLANIEPETVSLELGPEDCFVLAWACEAAEAKAAEAWAFTDRPAPEAVRPETYAALAALFQAAAVGSTGDWYGRAEHRLATVRADWDPALSIRRRAGAETKGAA
jgi:hypothetical protein